MCGIGGIVSSIDAHPDIDAALDRLCQVQQHRGPDAKGRYVTILPSGTLVGLAHQRLAILDLTERSNQPLRWGNGRYALIYNGEVYNYRELALRMDRPEPAGDTEVVAAALERWGAEAFEHFNGMWALAFLDLHDRRLLLARDRLGVKPLYYRMRDGRLVFASEIKGVFALDPEAVRPEPSVVARYLMQAVTDTEEQTFFSEVLSIPPGGIIEIDLGHMPSRPLRCRRFWVHPFERRERRVVDDAPAKLREMIRDAVDIRLRADVPVAMLLSGGLDSSTLVGAARDVGADVLALSVVSDDPASDESRYIDQMARYAGIAVEKVKIDLDPLALFERLPEVCWANDEPLGGMSAVAHRCLMERAREHGITVLLTGQGADEQLGGYNKFFYFYLLDCLRKGKFYRGALAAIGAFLNGTVWREFRLSEAKRYMPGQYQRQHLGRALESALLAETGAAEYQRREWLDMTRFSVPMLLHYEDRMSMSVGREMRVPFLDYRIVELLASVPADEKLKGGWPKHILREAIEGWVPEDIRWRADKKGFNIPEESWMRGPFRRKLTEIFRGDLLSVQLGLLRPDGVRILWHQFLEGRRWIGVKDVFTMFCLETWARQFERFLKPIA